jgi:hypothetical protein
LPAQHECPCPGRPILDALKRLSLGRGRPDRTAVARFNEATNHGWEMARYRDQLARAVTAITGKAEEQGVASLFQPGGTVISRDTFQGIDDFEVVAYLIVQNEPQAA